MKFCYFVVLNTKNLTYIQTLSPKSESLVSLTTKFYLKMNLLTILNH